MKKSSKTKQTSNEQTHSVIQATNPEWVETGLSGVGQTLSDLGTTDPYSFVTGANDLQLQAGRGAAGLTPSAGFDEAMDIYRGVAGGQPAAPRSGLDNLQAWMNPYLKDVVETSLADFDYGAGVQRAQAALDLGGDETFGGSNGSIYKSMLEGELGRGRGALAAGLRSNAFDTAAGYASRDADRASEADARALQARLASAAGLAGVADARGAAERANIGLQAGIGGELQELEQREAAAPLSTAGALASMWSALPLSLLHGQIQDGTRNSTSTSKTTVSDPMGAISGVLGGLGSLAGGLGAMGLGFGKASGG